MAGRGRGRGRAALSFNIESLGFGRGEALPVASLQPPPLYPLCDFKPVALNETEENAYLLALKQEFRGAMKESPFYITPLEKKKDVQRYTDKYQQNTDNTINWQPDWQFFPPELKIRTRKAIKIKPSSNKSKTTQRGSEADDSLMVKTLDELEKKESLTNVEDEDEGGKKTDDEEEKEGDENEEELYEEDELEEETDYNVTYFDNGENYGMEDEDDNLDEGAIY